jgi:hypothetical protein
MREIVNIAYDTSDIVDENFFYANRLIEPATLDRQLTYLWGKDDNTFPLMKNTVGSAGKGRFINVDANPGAMNTIKMNDPQYVWPVMGRAKFTTNVVGLVNSSITKPAYGMQLIEVYFEDNRAAKDYGITTPDGGHILRVEGEPTKVANNKFKYILQLFTTDPNAYVSLDNFANGKSWSISAPSVPQSMHTGNRSNRMTPGKLTNQYSYWRFSDQITGNAANKVVKYVFDTDNGGTESLWMPEEMRQFEFNKRMMLENKLWYDEYNRNEQGEITTIDQETGRAVPMGAGVKQFIKEAGGHRTYSNMTIDLIDGMINEIYANRSDMGIDDIVIYGGMGAKKEWERAIRTNALSKSYYDRLSWAEVREIRNDPSRLEYGAYFEAYRTIYGNVVTFIHSRFFDLNPRAQADKQNGRIIEGLPLESFNMVILDHSVHSGGTPNIVAVAEKGKENNVYIYHGAEPLPGSWASIPETAIATRTAMNAYEVTGSIGITIKNATTSAWFEKVL